jgi:hypothetical protein
MASSNASASSTFRRVFVGVIASPRFEEFLDGTLVVGRRHERGQRGDRGPRHRRRNPCRRRRRGRRRPAEGLDAKRVEHLGGEAEPRLLVRGRREDRHHPHQEHPANTRPASRNASWSYRAPLHSFGLGSSVPANVSGRSTTSSVDLATSGTCVESPGSSHSEIAEPGDDGGTAGSRCIVQATNTSPASFGSSPTFTSGVPIGVVLGDSEVHSRGTAMLTPGSAVIVFQPSGIVDSV